MFCPKTGASEKGDYRKGFLTYYLPLYNLVSKIKFKAYLFLQSRFLRGGGMEKRYF